MIVPGEEGLRDIRVVEAIYKSVKSGKMVKI
jgi:glucose-fructose oxidoreductase